MRHRAARPPPSPTDVSSVDVDVWVARLDGSPFDDLRTLLTPAEVERSRRFSFAVDASRFTSGRAVRRHLVARRTGLPASDLHFMSGPTGKPYVVEAPDLAFSVSHSDGLMCMAFSGRGPVGVDIERMAPGIVDASISLVAFSEREVALLRELPPAARTKTFYSWWVRKEAIVKGTGEGLGPAMQATEMPLRRVIEPETLLIGEWHCRDLRIEEGFSAAVATREGVPAVSLRLVLVSSVTAACSADRASY